MVNKAPLHASAFSYQGAGCLILGKSGAGKSSLLAEVLVHGAKLVADDQVVLEAQNGTLAAHSVPHLEGVMELRGMGLVRLADTAASQQIHLAVTLAKGASVRLPEPENWEFEGVSIPHLKLPPPPALNVASLLLYLKAVQEGRTLPADWHPLG